MTQDVPSPSEDELSPSKLAVPADTLKLAIRRARADDAERSGARAELRAARLGRLEMLQDSLQPLVSQIPPDVEIFDIALVPSSDPRLFIDMIGFVETSRDARGYVLQQDTRHGRIRIAESESLDTMVDAVTDYVARRLRERDKALASDARTRDSANWREGEGSRDAKRDVPHGAIAATASVRALDPVSKASSASPAELPRRAPLRLAGIMFAFVIDLLGAITLFMILGAIGWYAWTRLHSPM